MAKLIVISGEERQEFELAAFNTIGRHPDNTIQILDRIISKEHAQIQRAADGRYLLRDLRSLNGTFMRGERVAITTSPTATSSRWARPASCSSTSRRPTTRSSASRSRPA